MDFSAAVERSSPPRPDDYTKFERAFDERFCFPEYGDNEIRDAFLTNGRNITSLSNQRGKTKENGSISFLQICYSIYGVTKKVTNFIDGKTLSDKYHPVTLVTGKLKYNQFTPFDKMLKVMIPGRTKKARTANQKSGFTVHAQMKTIPFTGF